MSDYKLTQYSHGAGCGCKISPKVLDTILQQGSETIHFPNLIVGNESRDDAAAFDLNDGTLLLSTTDFFMPIVDDPVDFGRIASVNAISDIYAMGGQPLLAIAILGWPVNTLPAEVANQVIEGSRQACREAGIPLAGGHSIDSPEPIFGLAVSGRVKKAHLKQNGGATAGCLLYLTKPLGVGILSTAQKKGLVQAGHAAMARDNMVQLNSIGADLGALEGVKAMTDVTGFGLAGHLIEMCEASDLSAELNFDQIPFLDLPVLEDYLAQKCVPGGTHRNLDSYGHKLFDMNERERLLLADPQTSGGLLVAVHPDAQTQFEAITLERGLTLKPIGKLIAEKNLRIYVNS
ncbi:MAG TPA: selenide, water dikinase SelD [Saprospiraceae bacterium]|nr:selenide, water dikinase SelD [Saprospiraceae bacterium]HMQ83632.1 selenide, water dikinase SelD [Saprospiraceae bacterium]